MLPLSAILLPLPAAAASPRPAHAPQFSENGSGSTASNAEIKAAYRQLVKQHHPDAGGDDQQMLALNAAWEVLGDAERRKAFDRTRPQPGRAASPADLRRASRAHERSVAADDALVEWLRRVYAPIDRMLGEVINLFPKQLKALSADPYDDELMEAFCSYLEASGRRMEKVKQLFQSVPTPASARGFGYDSRCAQERGCGVKVSGST